MFTLRSDYLFSRRITPVIDHIPLNISTRTEFRIELNISLHIPKTDELGSSVSRIWNSFILTMKGFICIFWYSKRLSSIFWIHVRHTLHRVPCVRLIRISPKSARYPGLVIYLCSEISFEQTHRFIVCDSVVYFVYYIHRQSKR